MSEDKIKLVLFDHCNKVGIGWELKDGTRDSIRLEISKDVAEILSDVQHGRI